MNAFRSLKWLVPLLLLAGVGNAWADRYGHGNRYVHGGARVGVVIGAPWGWSPWYYPPPYYYSPSIVIERSPPVYIEQPAPQAAQENYWYYCPASRTYYPYVNACPGGWQRVLPQPPNSPDGQGAPK